MLSANCSLLARFQWNKTRDSLISDSLCKTFYISEAHHSSKQLFLSFVAVLISLKFGGEPMLSLNRRTRKKTCSMGCNFGFCATCGGIDYFLFYTLSVFFPLVIKFQSVFLFCMRMSLSSLHTGAKLLNWVLLPSLLTKNPVQLQSKTSTAGSQEQLCPSVTNMNLLVYMCSLQVVVDFPV